MGKKRMEEKNNFEGLSNNIRTEKEKSTNPNVLSSHTKGSQYTEYITCKLN